MQKRITIKDIAREMNVSTATVHRALYGKKGVGEELQAQIQELCRKYGYQINGAASALKRGTVRLAAVLPESTGVSQFYYERVWKGVDRCHEELRNYNLEIVKKTYRTSSKQEQALALEQFFQSQNEPLDGLLTVGHFGDDCKEILKKFTKKGVPLFLVCDDSEDCGRIACVQANYDLTGQMVAELLASQLPQYSTVLVCAGDTTTPSHLHTVNGFEKYLGEKKVRLHIQKLYGYYEEELLKSNLRNELCTNPDITGIFSVSARLSVVVKDVLEELKLSGQIRVVASDLFADTIAGMKHGTIQNIVFKDPEQQAYQATKLMADYAVNAVRPEFSVNYVESKVVFQSSLPFYEKQI